ncbi:MAG: FIST C-terminal domain-containing protein [Rhodospirillaceae bacterium]|nr:FIST C-terminal domain-containing protein [Rhodospirillaceae bacterium]
MDRFRVAHAAGADGLSLADACVAMLGGTEAQPGLGFVYATDYLSDELPQIIGRLRQGTGIRDWVGTVGIGVSANPGDSAGGRPAEHYDTPAVAVMTAPLPPDSYRLFEPLRDSRQGLGGRHAEWLDRRQPAFGVVHADPRNPLTPGLVAALAEETGAHLVGGLTCSRAGFRQVAGTVVEGGVSGVLFSDAVAVLTGLSQGCRPIGPPHTATAVEGHVVRRLDGRPALEVFCAEIGPQLARDLRRVAGTIFVALPVHGADAGDYLVRNLVSIDMAEGSLGIAADIAPGDRLMFARRDRPAAESDLRRMLACLAARTDRPVKGALYHCCVARGPNLFGAAAEETRLITAVLGDIPLVGFLANGEICNNRLYGYTGVLTLFL